MATTSPTQLTLTVGTRDGLYLFESDVDRAVWTRRGGYLEGYDVSHAFLDERDGRSVWVAANGADQRCVFRSADHGLTWDSYGQELDTTALWHVEPVPGAPAESIYLGVAPAALYRTDDGGQTWQSVAGFNEHASRCEWWEGGGGMCLHTIVPNARQPDEILLAMSVGGVFYTADGGQSWEPRNNGIPSLASMWEQESGNRSLHDVHRCAHKLVRHPENGVLFQQNHLGVFRSDDLGLNWIDISAGLPDPFGFVIDMTNDGTVYVVPQHDWLPDVGVRISGQLAVYRSRDHGQSWTKLSDGLPVVDDVTLYREGMATDRLAPGGVYIGTSDGQLFQSADGGDT